MRGKTLDEIDMHIVACRLRCETAISNAFNETLRQDAEIENKAIAALREVLTDEDLAELRDYVNHWELFNKCIRIHPPVEMEGDDQ